MKKIIVVASYEAYVPDDMTVSMVQDLIEEKLRNNLEYFSICVEDYPNEDEQCPDFNLNDVICGTELMISIGGE